ncbi:MAG: hypothetical protein H6679_01320 [Epsilonproteobacteria bacterium]|nr:hypothetical protein [Campylobacterota bacterium]
MKVVAKILFLLMVSFSSGYTMIKYTARPRVMVRPLYTPPRQTTPTLVPKFSGSLGQCSAQPKRLLYTEMVAIGAGVASVVMGNVVANKVNDLEKKIDRLEQRRIRDASKADEHQTAILPLLFEPLLTKPELSTDELLLVHQTLVHSSAAQRLFRDRVARFISTHKHNYPPVWDVRLIDVALHHFKGPGDLSYFFQAADENIENIALLGLVKRVEQSLNQEAKTYLPRLAAKLARVDGKGWDLFPDRKAELLSYLRENEAAREKWTSN